MSRNARPYSSGDCGSHRISAGDLTASELNQVHPSPSPLPIRNNYKQPQPPHTDHFSRTSYSDMKRKRAIEDDDHAIGPRSLARSSSTSDFSSTTKARVRADFQNKCWHCGTKNTDICHVIGDRDHAVSTQKPAERGSTK